MLGLPFISGLAGYGWTLTHRRSGNADHNLEKPSGEALAAGKSGRDSSLTDVDAAFAAVQEERSRLEQVRRDELKAMDPGALKRSILELMARRAVDPSVDAAGDEHGAPSPLEWLVRELGGKEHGDGLAWIEQNLPEKREQAISGWAVNDPHGALEHVLESSDDGKRPCNPRTLMWLLVREASLGPEALRAAAESVPWERFDPRDDLIMMREATPHGLDYRPWVESGAAQSLAEQGVQIYGLFGPWYHDDPDAALAAWASWPMTSVFRSDEGFDDMLRGSLDSEDSVARLAAALAADPTLAEKAAGTVKRLLEDDPELADSLREKLPQLLPVATPPDSSPSAGAGP
jgi:hypothetical protein